MISEFDDRGYLTRFAWLSIAAALFTITFKGAAYFLTGSVGLLSDAAESLINLATGVMALAMLTIAARPPDEDHAYGHSKAEYFSSGAEGALILLASLCIAVAAVVRFIHPRELEQIGLGLVVSTIASLVNLVVSLVLRRAGHRHHSVALVAGGQHLLADVWTSAGVVLGVGLVALTGWRVLDPIVALLVALQIGWSGSGIVRRSVHGLMDTALPAWDQETIRRVLTEYEAKGVEYHALRTHQAGALRFVSVHILVPGEWSVQDGHHILEAIETGIRDALPNTVIFTHLEPIEDPVSWNNSLLGRDEPPRVGRSR